MKLLDIRNLKIWYKILIIFQFMMIPAILIFIVLLVITHQMQDLHGSKLIKNLTSITAAYNVENSLLNLKELKANYMLDGEKKWLREFDEKVEQFNFWYNKAFQVANSDEERDLLSVMSLEFSSYLKAHKEIIYLADSGRKDQAIRLLLIKSMNHYNAIYDGCEHLIANNRDTITANQGKLIISERRAAVGEIAAGISHELNNPIGIICGFAELLIRKKTLSDGDMEYIEDIHCEAVRCK